MSAVTPVTILIATGNPGKAREIEAVLGQAADDAVHSDAAMSPSNIRWKTFKDFPPIPEPIEDADTFAANAALKACYYSKATGLWTLADDSGLEVDALGGQPGVRSAYFADEIPETAAREIRDPANNRKLIAMLKDVPAEKRTARFRCALSLADGDRILATSEGAIEGVIIDLPRGENGFGYDPHFLVPSLSQTTAEIESDHKNRISHRGQALSEMCRRLRTLLIIESQD
ncbi:MAG: non-canonical purine NTP pyrophosphatase [Planctomycetes bacterium]|nr:non-canonical purine NTP pyrophosphatase [Planctomycetota bacterium]